MTSSASKADRFEELMKSIKNCTFCDRMYDRKRVFSKSNGNINSKVIFIAEAPGRLGAECAGVPLCGDITGKNFEKLLDSIGWTREDVFVTNSILCNPQDDEGNNAPPKAGEIENCSRYLQMTIELINPMVVVTLGIKALDALKYICPHNYVLREHVANSLAWNHRALFPLYHMSPKVLNMHRSFDQQKDDFKQLAQIINVVSLQ